MVSIKKIRKRKLLFAIVLFLMLFSGFHTLKPGFAYNLDGGIRPFGIGYRAKTVVPLWLIAIILAVLSYILILGITQ
jgi:polyferredoxin